MRQLGSTRREPLVGLVVEGRTEYQALPEMLVRLGLRCTTPISFRGQPVEAAVDRLVERCLLRHVRAQLRKKPDLVIVVLDLEQRQSAAHRFRAEVRRELRTQVRRTEGQGAARKTEVVVCDRLFENWLLADPRGIAASAYLEQDLTRAVSCHADGKDALSLLRGALRKGETYRKAEHGPRLAAHVRVEDRKVRLCSESLRQFVDIVRGLKGK